MTLRTALIAIILAALTPSLDARPEPARIQTALDRFITMRESANSAQDFEDGLAELRADYPELFDFETVDARTIEDLTPILMATDELGTLASARLSALIADPENETERVIALVNGMFFTMIGARTLPTIDALSDAIEHDRLPDALREGYAGMIFPMLAYSAQYRADDFGDLREGVLNLGVIFEDALPPEEALASAELVGAARAVAKSEEDRAKAEQIRAGAARVIREAMPGLTQAQRNDGMGEMMQDALLSIDGAYARGELLDHQAPSLDFIWTNPGSPLGKIDDLRQLEGRVVMIDFWATWCGPCVASIPKLRETAAHYADQPFTILGVTSLQGSHADPNIGTIDTRNTPDRELDLMAEFVAQRGITWPVVFSEQDVMNPEYGVKGIPHIVLIDADGVVRHRDLHPLMPQAQLRALIDSLLDEATKDTDANPEG